MRIAVFNHKGGAGKSTLTAHIGFRAEERRVQITIFDSDRQANTMQWLSSHSWKGEAFDLGTVRVTNDRYEGESARNCVVDCPPSFGVVTEQKNIDVWLIPVDGRFALEGCVNVLSELQNLPARKIVVVNKALDSKFGSAELREIEMVGAEVYRFPIPQQDIVRKAEMMGKPTWKIPYGLRSATTQNLKTFADFVIDGCPEKGVFMPDEARSFRLNRKPRGVYA